MTVNEAIELAIDSIFHDPYVSSTQTTEACNILDDLKTFVEDDPPED